MNSCCLDAVERSFLSSSNLSVDDLNEKLDSDACGVIRYAPTSKNKKFCNTQGKMESFNLVKNRSLSETFLSKN